MKTKQNKKWRRTETGDKLTFKVHGLFEKQQSVAKLHEDLTSWNTALVSEALRKKRESLLFDSVDE